MHWLIFYEQDFGAKDQRKLNTTMFVILLIFNSIFNAHQFERVYNNVVLVKLK